MAAFSKIFFETHFRHYTCKDFYHPWEKNCSNAHLQFFTSCFFGSFKYYAIFYVVSALLKYKQWNKKYLKEHLKCFTKSLVTGTLIGSTFFIYACYMRAIFGKFYYNTGIFWPGTIAGLNICLATSAKQSVMSQIFTQLALESFVYRLENNNIIKLRHIGISTLCFMIVNGYLMYLLRLEANKDSSKRKYPIWIFHPPSSLKFPDSPCSHSEQKNCLDYIFQGTKTYFIYGCAVELCKIIINNFSTIKSFPSTLPSLLLKLNLKAGLFAGGYVGIYRAITCYLCQKYRQDDPKYALVGGFLCGAVYPFFPMLNLILTAISSSLYVHIWELEKIYKVPMTNLLFAVCLGYMFHLRCFTPDVCPKAAAKLISAISNGKADIIIDNLHAIATKMKKNI